MDVWEHNEMQKRGTTKMFYIKSFPRVFLVLMLSLTNETQVHMHLLIVPHMVKQIAMPWNLQYEGNILGWMEVWIQHGPPSNFFLRDMPARLLYLKLAYISRKLSQVRISQLEIHMVNLKIFPEETGTYLQHTMNKQSKVVTNDQKC